MAATAISPHVRATKPTRNPNLLHHFSSSSSSTSSSLPPTNTGPQTPNSAPPNPQSRFSSYFSDVKASLRQPHQPPRQQQGQQTASRDQILKNLTEFRQRSAAPTSGENASSPAKRVSFQELFQRDLTTKEGEPASEAKKGGKHWLDAIHQSLSQMRANTPKTNEVPLSLKKYKESFTLFPPDTRNQPSVNWSPQKLPESVFSKEFQEKRDGDSSPAMKTEFLKTYSYKELGEKLRKLRPEGKPEVGFSLQELNERLVKLRELEEREMTSKLGNGIYMNLRESLMKLKTSENKQTSKCDDLVVI